ncbi:MAG: DUF1805 domain-containing protein [Defluviitaleaceae bacterium]|nr:DUF1805 domain-containing protein [Defluviitaleaceae bacterium]
MFQAKKIMIENHAFTTYEVFLPKTTLLVVTNEIGYIMCAAVDIDFFNNTPKLAARKIIAGRAEGVRTIEELLDAPLAKLTHAAEEIGIKEGTVGRDALLLMAKAQNDESK